MESFRVDVPDDVLDDLQTRLKLTRWVDDFSNEGWQYGTNTACLKELVAYWIDGYDWRKQERAINAYPSELVVNARLSVGTPFKRNGMTACRAANPSNVALRYRPGFAP